jgi:hypothetical protein
MSLHLLFLQAVESGTCGAWHPAASMDLSAFKPLEFPILASILDLIKVVDILLVLATLWAQSRDSPCECSVTSYKSYASEAGPLPA